MTSKFWFLTGKSLSKKIKTKWFLIANIIIAVAVIGLINLDTIIGFFGGEFSKVNNVVLLDNTNYSVETFKQNMDNANNLFGNDYETEYEIYDVNNGDIKEYVKDSNKIAIVFDEDSEAYIKASIISDSKIDSMYYQTLLQALTGTKTEIAMSLTDLDKEELAKISSPINIDRIILDENSNNEEESTAMIMGTVFPTVILPFFILIIFLVQMLGSEINEEKSTRSMEVIISNVSPKTHFFSKIVAANSFVLIQGALLLLYAGIGLLLRNCVSAGTNSSITAEISNIWNSLQTSGIVDKLYYIIPITLLLMVLSFLAYSLVAGILASMTVNVEDYQQIQSPIIIVCLLSYYLAIMAGMFEGSTLIKVLSYVPFISCLLAPALLVIGQITIIDVFISIGLLLLFNFIAIKYGMKIYKTGILNYSTDKMWHRLFKAAKEK